MSAAVAQLTDPDALTSPFALTKNYYRDVYPAVNPTNSKNSAKGKSVLITGGGRGIGLGITLSWAKAGASTIIITGRTMTFLESAIEEIRKISPSTKALAFPCNVTDPTAVQSLFAKTKSEIGHLDVLICNVGGISHAEADLKIGEKSPKDFFYDIDINLKSDYLCIHHYLNAFGFVNNPTPPTGTIISVSTATAGFVLPGLSSYGIAKLAAVRLMEFLELEYPTIRGFSVAPGTVLTDNLATYLHRFALDTMELAGGWTTYLASEQGDYLKGDWVSVNWDAVEMEEHKEEIVGKQLLKSGFLNVTPRPGGYPWGEL
ncbi:NAD(P)-binding protein [Amniculicola lignicola CBS 123094]|uniref:NAD(P)-binding protein n=1 Tax=Amniculicola lignicola CBS 123094 TaxID=1392246 RepID=A0A6A5WVA0_9PLEO|nr:NAD(P)-binding protein [Amniculicola lignicola CBS 123094]